MINLTYYKYALPRVGIVVSAGLDTPAKSQPDQFIDATSHAISKSAQQISALPMVELPHNLAPNIFAARPVTHLETAAILLNVLDRIEPLLGDRLDAALQEGRFGFHLATYLPHSWHETHPDTGAHLISCAHDGSVTAIRSAMHMVGKLIAAETLDAINATEASKTMDVGFGSSVLSHFLEKALFDPANLLKASADLAGPLGKTEAAMARNYAINWRVQTLQHQQGLAQLNNMNFTDVNLRAAYGIHLEWNAPASLLAGALYEAYSAATPERRHEMLDTIVVPVAQAMENGSRVSTFQTLAALVDVETASDLETLYMQQARMLYAPEKRLVILERPSDADVNRYTRSYA